MNHRSPLGPGTLAAAVALALLSSAERVPAQTAYLLDCTACHMTTEDVPLEASRYPLLKGKPARYLDRQLDAYREGARFHRQMSRSAIALGAGAPAAARLYADLPPPELGDAPGPAPDIVTDGAWERGIAPCASCHAFESDLRGRTAPMLHGQPEPYLAEELRAYADGTRRTGPMGRMQAYAAALTGTEIAEIAAWYAGFAGDAAPPDPAEEGAGE